MELKPIHKYNGGLGATLCHKCRKIISEGITEDLYCEKHGGGIQYKYKLTRLNDGMVNVGNTALWIEWNEDGTFKKRHDDISFGRSLVIDFNMGNFKWMTTKVNTYTKEFNIIEFQTKNSNYILEKIQ